MAYLEGRYSLVPYSNTCGYYITDFDLNLLDSKFSKQIASAALNSFMALMFFEDLRKLDDLEDRKSVV